MRSARSAASVVAVLAVVVGRPRAPLADEAAPATPPAPPQLSQERAAPHLSDGQHFTIDPVVDGLLVVGGVTFDELLSAILSTGEIKPQPPGDPSRLLSIDRWAVTQTIDPSAATRSNVGLSLAYAYAVLDPIFSGVRDGRRAFFVDAILYAESLAVTGAFTEATKIGVRRPRPIDYASCGTAAQAQSPECTSNTDLQLSFFSGHASATGAITGTATYLAFARSGWRSPRPWITLVAGTALTAFVSYERVRAGEHFPTDVIMGSLVGAGVGVLVPHFHRRPHYHDQELEAPPVIVGYAPARGGGGALTAEWRF
ncbi:MAG TPA: phosphatase PAP2 family protein [Polyangia bacterium]|nr:phosphatase PAP2 family protein [Polyangia bacterium]